MKSAVSDCPPWCDQRHFTETDPRDQFHERGSEIVSGVLRTLTQVDGEASALTLVCEVRAVAFTSATEHDDVWVTIELGEAGAGITLSAETLRRILPRVHALMAQLEA